VARVHRQVRRELDIPDAPGCPLELVAHFHDVGKVAMPDALVTKPSPLTPGEAAIIRRHVTAGFDILASTRTPRELAPIVLATHEWFGGGGYPLKLAGAAIPIGSRIISVVDGYDDMKHCRESRPGTDTNDAVAELLRCQSTQFDPHVVAAFLAVLGLSLRAAVLGVPVGLRGVDLQARL